MGKINGPRLFDPSLLVQAGINPKTGLPARLGNTPCEYKEDIKKCIRIVDEADAVNRYKWIGLPCNLSSQELERMLYYHGQLCFFYLEDLDEFVFAKYALDGTIDFYGRFNHIHPVPLACGVDEDSEKRLTDYFSTIKLKVQYGIMLDEPEIEDITKSAVILRDYTNQLPQTIIPRQQLNDPLCDIEAECIPYMRTALINGTGVMGVRATDADACDAITEAGKTIQKAALVGEQLVPIQSNFEFQELSGGSVAKAEEFFLAMQSLDNFRLGTYGLENGGLFEKKAHTTDMENAVNKTSVGQVFNDGLTIRQNFCDIVNSIWGIGIWCVPNESAMGVDNNQDGMAYDDDSTSMTTGVEGGESNEEDSTI